MISFRVYTPGNGKAWSTYRHHGSALLVPWIWLVWLARGLRTRIVGPAKGRKVTLDDMLAEHPGRKDRCLCRGTGVLTTHRGGQAGVQFCAKMLAAFRAKAAFRCVDAKGGPRWRKGYAPEDLADVPRKAERVRPRR